MFDITHYFDWENIPAVVGDVSETHFSGFYLDVDDNTWNKAKPVTLLELFRVAEELDKNNFEATFGVIGKDLPPLPNWTGTFGDIGDLPPLPNSS